MDTDKHRSSRSKRENRLVLVLGGARSGKSSFALRLAEKWFRKPLYLATAEACDDEMEDRIDRHRKARGRKWRCAEAPLNAADIIRGARAHDGILLDCATIWLSNVLLKEGEPAFAGRRKALLHALKKAGKSVIIVSNEVGMGIVPDSRLGRNFRDLAGWLNQDLAAAADTVVFVAAGLPMVLKGKLES